MECYTWAVRRGEARPADGDNSSGVCRWQRGHLQTDGEEIGTLQTHFSASAAVSTGGGAQKALATGRLSKISESLKQKMCKPKNQHLLLVSDSLLKKMLVMWFWFLKVLVLLWLQTPHVLVSLGAVSNTMRRRGGQSNVPAAASGV